MAVAAGVASPLPVAAGGVWLEILPVFLDARGIGALRPDGGGSWRLAYGGDDVHRVIARELAAAGLEPRAVHSTSWRQERGAVVLTHVAAVGRPAGDVPGFRHWPVRQRAMAHGTALTPPARIDLEHVVAHALRHLAWLAVADGAVRRALGPEWRSALRRHRAEPFRLFQAQPAR
jgi:hypothetical protein